MFTFVTISGHHQVHIKERSPGTSRHPHPETSKTPVRTVDPGDFPRPGDKRLRVIVSSPRTAVIEFFGEAGRIVTFVTACCKKTSRHISGTRPCPSTLIKESWHE